MTRADKSTSPAFPRMLANVQATVLSIFLCAGASAVAQEQRDWGPLEGTWSKLPVACGRNLESTCGDDRFVLKQGLLDARKTCAGVNVLVRSRTRDTWHVEVVGAKPCIWNSRRVRSFVFTLEPGNQRLRFVAYAGRSATPDEALFRGYGFERD